MGIMMAQAARMILDNDFLERPSTVHKACGSPESWEMKTSIGLQFAGFPFRRGSVHGLSRRRGRDQWSVAFALDTGGATDGGGGGGQEGLGGESSGLGRTRLGTIVRAAANQLLEKLNSTRKNFPTKIFLLLLGFYTANALATILGQTGDWDVLVAGIAVAAVEGIGVLVYRRSPSVMRSGRLQTLIEMVNYWKAGVCLGLFVDAFKLGS